MENNKFSFKKRINSFGYAFNGLRLFFATQPNAWIHFAATILVVLCGYVFNVNKYEWCILMITIAAVFSAEMINTAIEFLCDSVTLEQHPTIKIVKDISAAAVLIIAIIAIIIAGIIFVPKLVVFTN